MVEWSSATEIGQDFQIIDKVVHALLGLYVWEFLTTLDFEWEIITGKRKFQWPMISYFLGRYFQLFAFIGQAIVLDTASQLDCQPVYRFAAFMNYGALTLASINLGIRTIVSLDYNRIAMTAVTLLASGQWALVILAVTAANGTYISTPQAAGCTPLGDEKYSKVLFIYTTCFNFLLLASTVVKHFTQNIQTNNQQVKGQSRFMHLVFNEGLFFFITAFIADLVVVIFMALNLNRPMNSMFQTPASTFSTIAGCRVVKHLMKFTPGAPASSIGRSTATSSGNRNISNGNLRGIQSTISSSPGVHVQMETFSELENYEKKEASESVNDTDLEANKAAAL
ncbi:hypothetical protein CPB83DRAFT_308066 [Crepidotus variabilis]|uniref:Uncharacterized protein n=1 Tax=Crepidotus variabilis TaxID=179855 RepID=A0A9P6EGL4_9AGAR|nr:hypothetical protein CPB83DRAFT_308066 [Crepidotus variabilis]